MISCEIVRTVDHMLSLEVEWRDLASQAEDQDFYLTWDWFYAVVHCSRSLPGELRIFVVRRGTELLALIPGIRPG